MHNNQINIGQINIGDKVKISGVGGGEITGFTQRGYPQVNEVACAWIEFEDGRVFDPHGHFLAGDLT